MHDVFHNNARCPHSSKLVAIKTETIRTLLVGIFYGVMLVLYTLYRFDS